jgi:hypothetical protein
MDLGKPGRNAKKNPRANGVVGKKGQESFFFEKKNQKTFPRWAVP